MDGKCTHCGTQWSPTAFYRSSPTVCKECTKRRVRERTRTNPAVQEYDRARAKRPDRQAKAARISKEWRERHPEAYRAQCVVNNAIRDGRLTKGPCSICGATEHIHGHHRDYSKPFDVIWLCARCHHRIHATFPELGGHFHGEPA